MFCLSVVGNGQLGRSTVEEVDQPPHMGGWCENPRFLEKASGIHMKHGFTLNEWENPMRAALQAFKNAGVKIIWHSDGYITPIINSLINAGTNGFQEKYGVDFAALTQMKATYWARTQI